MRYLIPGFLGILLCTSLFGEPSRQADDPAKCVQQLQDAIVGAKGPDDRAFGPTASEGFAALFKKVGRAGIPALRAHSDDSISLQAAWQDVVITVPEKESRPAVRPDHDKLVWFLGFLEGRARVRAPKPWADSLLESRAFGRNDIYPGRRSDDDWVDDHHKSGLDFVSTPRDTSLKQDGDRIILQIGTESRPFPSAILTENFGKDPDGKLSGSVSGLITHNRSYIAVHDHSGYPHKLYCIDRFSGKTSWKTNVWGNFWGDMGGPGTAWVSLVESDGRIFVFGSSIGMNVEAFRVADGKPLFRFATTY